MRLRLGVVALLCAAAACSDSCGKPKKFEPKPIPEGDASYPGYSTADLRTAISLAAPEWRGMAGLVGIAVLEETLAEDPSNGGDLGKALSPQFAPRRWKAASSDAGSLIAQNKPFFCEAERVNGHPVVRVGLIVPGEQFVDVMQTPAPLTSEQLAQLLPVPKGTRFLNDVFIFEVHYRSALSRSSELVHQLFDGLLRSGWTIANAPHELLGADAGYYEDDFKAELHDPSRGGKMTVVRENDSVAVTWEQPLLKR